MSRIPATARTPGECGSGDRRRSAGLRRSPCEQRARRLVEKCGQESGQQDGQNTAVIRRHPQHAPMLGTEWAVLHVGEARIVMFVFGNTATNNVDGGNSSSRTDVFHEGRGTLLGQRMRHRRRQRSEQDRKTCDPSAHEVPTVFLHGPNSNIWHFARRPPRCRKTARFCNLEAPPAPALSTLSACFSPTSPFTNRTSSGTCATIHDT